MKKYAEKLKPAPGAGFRSWSGRQDSNLRPLAPHASALPGCATSRNENFVGGKGKGKTD